MRPDILFPLFAPLTSLKGVGPRMAPLYERLCGGNRIVDLLLHLPSDVLDRSYSPNLRHAQAGRVATLVVSVQEHIPSARQGKPHRIIVHDGTATLGIAYFTAKGDYLEKLYPLGHDVVVSGMLERFGRGWSMNHPDYVLPPARRGEIPFFEPVYPLTEGLSRKMVHKTALQALEKIPAFDEWHDKSLMEREAWPSFRDAVDRLHKPRGPAIDESARKRLAYDELLADQLALAVVRRHHKKRAGTPIVGTGALTARLRSALPFSLTQGQEEALAAITHDMAAPCRMLRLVQGDVGAGKTIVALFAMLQAVEAGFQAALMAPTEILARQHAHTLAKYLAPLGLEVGVLTGKGRVNAARKETLNKLAQGTLSIVVGTHALFQEDVAFANLGIVVMDEQHRFGVNQRLQLAEKGKGVDILVMTATPIPRTLALTAYGDMDVCRIAEKPAGRQPIDTRVSDMAKLDEVIEGIARQIAKGAQAYWVCPLVEESEKSDLAAATQRADLLKKRLGENVVGLIHGRLPSEEKERVMHAFSGGALRVLVATTVIEVGMDVPAACLMIVEHAERFGLAQLHQLRGRIGRGAEKSTCLLLYHPPLGEIARARLTTLRETNDGFAIAEEDLRLRGPGEMLGVRQSGAPLFHVADLFKDRDLLKMAHDDARVILNNDPDLAAPRGISLRTLLYLFEKDAAIKLFRAG